ncbi:MAG TPA: sigma-70 family RNA polymerase sigma factor [Acidimicrobiales bacterium]|nr:sigma-70 family RNA polymerase sigma factor [Acidimicrobiales bacterium]
MSAGERVSSDESALLRGVVAQQPAAVRRFLDEVAPVVYGFIFARVGGDQPTAEDLLQDTLLEAVRSADNFRGDSALSTWMCTIARRRLARHYEAERRAETARRGMYLLGGVAGQPEDDLDRRDQVIRALGQLSPSHRQALVLKYLDGYSVEQVADRLGRSPVQTQSLLQRAREALRRYLEDDRDG